MIRWRHRAPHFVAALILLILERYHHVVALYLPTDLAGKPVARGQLKIPTTDAEVKSILESLDKQKASHVTRLTNLTQLKYFLRKNTIAVIGLFPDGIQEGGTILDSVVAESLKHVAFAEAEGAELCSELAAELSAQLSRICTTLEIGPSNGMHKSAIVTEDLHGSFIPLDQKWDCRALPFQDGTLGNFKIKVEVHPSNTHAILRATDRNPVVCEPDRHPCMGGWEQHLYAKCCMVGSNVEEDQHWKNLPSFGKPVKIQPKSITMLMPHDEGYSSYEGPSTRTSAQDPSVLLFEKWIRDRKISTVLDLDRHVYSDLFRQYRGTPTLVLVTHSLDHPDHGHDDEHCKVVMRNVGPKVRSRAVVVISGNTEDFERGLIQNLGMNEGSPLPRLFLQTLEGRYTLKHFEDEAGMHVHNYHYLSVENVMAFLKDYEEDKLKPDDDSLMSEPEPEEGALYTDGVKNLVGTTFKHEKARHFEKDMFVLCYAPWCGYCQKFKSNWQALAQKLKHVKTLEISQIDATRNTIYGQELAGYPTVLLFRAGHDRSSMRYTGDRSVEDMVKWLHDHTSIPFADEAPSTTRQPSLLDDMEDL